MSQITRDRDYPIIATRQDIENHKAKKGDFVAFGYEELKIKRVEKVNARGEKLFGHKWEDVGTIGLGIIERFDGHTGEPVVKYYGIKDSDKDREEKMNIGRISSRPQKELIEAGRMLNLATIGEESKRLIASIIETEKGRNELSMPSRGENTLALYNNDIVEVVDGEVRHRLLGENKLLTLKIRYVTGANAGRVGEFDFRTGSFTMEPLPVQEAKPNYSVSFKNAP